MPDISKTNLSPADVLRITEASLGREAADSEPLTAGQCNALYAVTLSDGSRCVLKTAPDPALRLRRGERWLMQTEISAMRLAQTLPGVPLPRILAEDRTCALCPAPFFIMEYAPGHSAALDRPRWSAEEHDRWYRRFGEMIRAIAEARAPSFGIVASGRTFSTLSAFAGDMLEMVLADCRDFDVDTGADADEIAAAKTMTPELGVRLMADLSTSLAETYDAIGACVGEELRGQVSDLQLVDFVDPSVAEPLIAVQDKIDPQSFRGPR